MQWNAFSQKTGENKYFPNEGLVFEKLFSCMKKYLIVNVKFYQGDSDVFRRWGLADFKLLFTYLKDFLKMVLSIFLKTNQLHFLFLVVSIAHTSCWVWLQYYFVFLEHLK